MDTSIIYPLIVPSTYYDKKVLNLPHERFPNKEYILTWVFFRTEGSMSHINQDEFTLLNNNYGNWQQEAFNNLRLSGRHFYTKFRADNDTGLLSFIIFTNEDGIGSSRILLSDELRQGFPEGYYISIPDRSVGLAISKNISPTEKAALNDIINEYYGCSGTAMTKSIMEPSDFLLPETWTKSPDSDVSEWIVEEIRSYK